MLTRPVTINTSPSANVSIVLVDSYTLEAATTADNQTAESITYSTSTTANSAGIVELNLWPTERATTAVMYAVSAGGAVQYETLADGTDGVTWTHYTNTGSVSAALPVWICEEGLPASEDGKNGDMYLNTSNGFVYQKIDDVWVYKVTIKGANGTPGINGTSVRIDTGTASGTLNATYGSYGLKKCNLQTVTFATPFPSVPSLSLVPHSNGNFDSNPVSVILNTKSTTGFTWYATGNTTGYAVTIQWEAKLATSGSGGSSTAVTPFTLPAWTEDGVNARGGTTILEKDPNSTYDVRIDVDTDKIRFMQNGGEYLGFYIPLAQGSAGALTSLIGSGGGNSGNSETVQVEDYGASPSASASTNVTAFNNAISTGKTIYIGPGEFHINDPITFQRNQSVVGSGLEATKIWQDNSGQDCFRVLGASFVSNLSCWGNGAGGKGIYHSNGGNALFFNVGTYQFESGIRLSASDTWSMYHCRTGSNTHGIYIGSETQYQNSGSLTESSGDGGDSVIHDCVIANNSYGIVQKAHGGLKMTANKIIFNSTAGYVGFFEAFSSTANYPVTSTSILLINTNSFEWNGYNILIQPQGSQTFSTINICGNQFSLGNSIQTGIYIDARASNCQIGNNVIGGAGTGIVINTGALSTSVTGNHFKGVTNTIINNAGTQCQVGQNFEF